MSSSTIEPADGLPQPQRRWSILTIAVGLAMSVVDGAIANVALPTIAGDLHAEPAFSIWIVNGYQLAITISLLPLASLGEIVGYRRVYLTGLCLFTLASAFCALSHTLLFLTIARIVQGFGAAGLMSVNAALVRFTYPRAFLGRGIGRNALVVAVSSAAGPTLAAGILAVGSWPYLFAVNIPLGVIAFVLGWRSLPHTARAARSFDWPSAGLSAITFGLGIFAVDSIGHGEPLLRSLIELGISLTAAALLFYRETKVAAPLLPVDLLRIPIFALSIATSIASFSAQMLAFVALPFYLQRRFGYSAVHMGLLMTPWPIIVAFAAPLAGRLVEIYPAGLLGGIGLLLLAAGLASLAFVPDNPTSFDFIWRMALSGFGFGLFQTPNNRTMIAAAPRERSGGASGMLGTARLLGQTTGATLVALLLGRYSPAEGTRIALFVGVGFALWGALLSILRLSSAGKRGAEHVRVREGQRMKGE